MKKLQLFIIFLFLFSSVENVAQTELQSIVQKAIEFHDKGNFEKAIETYKKALKINPNSELVNYEIALSYFSNADYKNALKHSKIVVKQDKDYILHGYMVFGSSLDMLGETKKSIKIFTKAIEKTGENYLLFYNIAVNYFKINDLENAEKNLIKAIENNPNHSSSHLILATIQNQKGNLVQALLSSHYFLLLEPNSNRTIEGYQILKENFNGNVSKDSNKPNNINITLSSNNDDQFGAAELMVSMLQVSKNLKENEGKTDDENFIENTKSFFNILGELKEEKNKDIWWEFYVTFFYDLAKSDYMETYCKFITQNVNQNSKSWITDNNNKIEKFYTWLNNYSITSKTP